MNQKMNSIPFNGTEEVGKILSTCSENIREEIFQRIVLPNYSFLRNGNSQCVGREGWYSAFFDQQFFVGAENENPFPVPVDCHSWLATEIDSRDGLLFRFFNNKAWLNLTLPTRLSYLEFTVPHLLMKELLQLTNYYLSDIKVDAQQIEPDRFGRTRLRLDIPECLLSSQKSILRLNIECIGSGIPAEIYPSSQDRRRLSFAVSKPRLFEK